MSTIFITGGTGYLGSYVIDELVRETSARLLLLTRARDRRDAVEKLWRAMQLHWSADQYAEALPRIDFVMGDLTAPGLGLDARARRGVVERTDSVLHIAASLNRKSDKACFNANLRGTLSVIKLAREIVDARGRLTRFGFVSTTAVCGKREHEIVGEDESIDWNRSDYDPYGRTKKMCEHMVHELLADVPRTIYRPSTVMGDSRFPRTTQFDMVRAYCFFADLPAVPIGPRVRQDIVNADFVGRAIARLHVKDAPAHDTYHLSAGASSPTASEVGEALAHGTGRRAPLFLAPMQAPFAAVVDRLASGPRSQVSFMASLMKVFLPYVTNDVVFDNRRVTEELGIAPVPFTSYCAELYAWAKSVRFEYPYVPLPASIVQHASVVSESLGGAP
ncbi:MAG TPA: SDR family oxidoreductase [Sandaracinaceae bacterium]